MSLAACIIRWPWTTRSPACLYRLFGRWSSSTDAVASLTCRNRGSCSIATLEQDDERPCPDAADAHDLAGHVDHFESLEQPASIILQGLSVGAELLVDDALELLDRQADARGQVTQRDHDRRLADDPVPAVDLLGQLRQGLQAVAAVRLLGRLLGLLLGLLVDLLPPPPFFAPAACLMASISSCSDKWAYQMSSVPISAKLAIASR